MTVVLYAVEGTTDAPVAEKLISLVKCEPRVVSASGGSSVIDLGLARWSMASNKQPMLILRDWDQADGAGCAPELVARLLGKACPTNVALRIVVRSVESWLMADYDAAKSFFQTAHIHRDPDSLDSPKLALVAACRRSTTRRIRDGMTPGSSTGGAVGPDYSILLRDFAQNHWDPTRAAGNSPSLARAITRLRTLVEDGEWN
jgi:hypothetical protein